MSLWRELIAQSVAPYSGQPEACLVRGRDGWHVGIRIENIAYPQTITALQGGIAACLFAGDEPQQIVLPPATMMPIPADLAIWAQGSPPLPVSHMSDPPIRLETLRRDQRERFLVDLFPAHGPSVSAGFQSADSLGHDSLRLDPLRMSSLRLDSVDPADDQARAAALGALASKAVIPNSDFPVSALMQTDIGIVGGCNVEFPSWNLGLCAERNAIHLALSMGAKTLGPMAIYAPKSQVCSPCGACRQTLAEWPGIDRVLLYHGDGSCSAHRVTDLLPFHFHASGLSSKTSGLSSHE
jgi:homotetrameric cytidine deaminase